MSTRRLNNYSWLRSLNTHQCLFCACFLWAIFIIIYIGSENVYERGTAKETSSHLRHKQLLPQNEERAAVHVSDNGREDGKITAGDNDFKELEESFEHGTLKGAVAKRRLQPRRPKKDRLLPLRVMFANAGKEDKERKTSFKWNSTEVPVADLRVKVNKPQVLLLVIVSSAPRRQDRRNAIRETWWKKCTGEVTCVFFTDGLQLKEKPKKNLQEESNRFSDINFSPTEDEAMIFGERFLYQIMWAKAKFNFQYLLRVDDDYFVCMDRLLNELPSRPKKNLSWGIYHCQYENLVYMDEAWALFSEDVIEQFLAQDLRSMLCHPFGDQTFTLWINATGINLTNFDDHRLHHWPPAGKINKFFSLTSVCDKHIGIHGSYPDLMSRLSMNSNDGPKNLTGVTLLKDTCSLPKVFDVNEFEGIYKFIPKLCLGRPRWISKWLKSWQGSE